MEPVRILVIYDSQTGNVEAMARAVADGARDAGAVAMVSRVDDVQIDEIPTYDAFAFGSPTHCGTMTAKMNEFFNHRMLKHWGKLKYRVAIAFTSSGGLSGGNELALLSLISAIISFVGEAPPFLIISRILALITFRAFFFGVIRIKYFVPCRFIIRRRSKPRKPKDSPLSRSTI